MRFLPSSRLPKWSAAIAAAAVSLAAAAPAAAQSGGATAWTDRLPAEQIPGPAREFRGVWMATVYNLDWPSRPGLPAATQQEELRGLLDTALRLGLNAVLLQVRPGGDALYRSPREPWSAVLTGTSGGDPGYDPLAFALEEAHRRGLELHAWINPFRARAGKATPAPTHWTGTHPEWVRGNEAHLFMDPGLPEVQQHVLAVVRDLVSGYDLDGIHIDDYFYPYPVFGPGAVRTEVPLGDEARWRQASRFSGQSLADWRRAHINRFVAAFHALTKSIRPSVRVGISPFGIWQPGIPAGIEARVNAYEHLYADSRLWLREGWCDYLAPQLYWPIQPAKQSFTTLLDWWNSQSRGRPVWPGISVDRIAGGKDSPLPLTELTDQLAAVRRTARPEAAGALLWRLKPLAADVRKIGSFLQQQAYPEKALPPAAPWLSPLIPAAPGLRAESGNGLLRLSWSAHDGTATAGSGPDSNPDEANASAGLSVPARPSVSGGAAPVRWWALQTLRGGSWKLEQVLFRKTETAELTLSGEVEAVSVRGISPTGIAGPAVALTAPTP